MNILKNGIKLSGSLVIAAVISLFLCISINVICSAAFTREIGYNAYVYETEASDKIIAEYSYNYTDLDGDGKDDGTDTKLQEYEAAGYTVSTVKLRSSLSGVGKGVFLTSTQVLTFIMVFAFASNSCYKQGFRDNNLVNIGQIKKDYLKGLKIGLIGNIPFFVLFILAVAMALGAAPAFRTVWYAFLNSHYYSVITLINDTAKTLSELTVVQFVLLFLVQLTAPAISTVAYILGLKEIDVFEKLVYKKEDK